jgi:hypothetical protein
VSPDEARAEADAMERARNIWKDAAATYRWEGSTGHYHEHIEHTFARALTAYGDQRAREARAAAIKEAVNLFDHLIVPASGKIGWGKIANLCNEIRAIAAKFGGE